MQDRQIDILWGIELKSVCLLAPLIIIGLTACASGPPKPANAVAEPVSADKTAELAAEQQRLHLVMMSHGNDFGRQLAALQDLIAAPAFKSLSVDDQFEALMRAARASLYSEQRALASDYIARVVSLPSLGFEDQAAAMEQAREIGNWKVAVRCLTSIAHHWPERLANLRGSTIAQVVNAADDLPRNDKLLLLQALYATHWKLQWNIEPSEYWRDLALFLVEKGSLGEAIDVSTHISAPYVLIGMRADRRFDAIVSAHPDQFDAELAADREQRIFQSLSDEHPKSLWLKARVMEALQHKEHYAAMLAASDSVVQAIAATNFPDKLYDDYVQEHDAYFELRSIALEREGRWDEAVAQMAAAVRDGNINQIINLAYLHCALDRPQDALAVLGPVGPTRTSAYGAMQAEVLRLQAAVELEDRDQMSRSMQYLGSHHADAPRTYLYGLVVANRLDLAAHYLITELEDKDLRQSVLPEIQEYLPTPGTKTELEVETRWQSVIAGKEVQAAIHRVGRIESYHLEAP
jgi:beta-barrel assembly-enhancing protease